MTVLDAYAVLAYLYREPAGAEVKALLRSDVAISTVNVVEVVDRTVRLYGVDPEDIEADLAVLARAGLRDVPLDVPLATVAGRLRARHYDRATSAVSLADCVVAAMALTERRPLATADPALAAMVRAEGGEVVALPDGRGRRP